MKSRVEELENVLLDQIEKLTTAQRKQTKDEGMRPRTLPETSGT